MNMNWGARSEWWCIHQRNPVRQQKDQNSLEDALKGSKASPLLRTLISLPVFPCARAENPFGRLAWWTRSSAFDQGQGTRAHEFAGRDPLLTGWSFVLESFSCKGGWAEWKKELFGSLRLPSLHMLLIGWISSKVVILSDKVGVQCGAN